MLQSLYSPQYFTTAIFTGAEQVMVTLSGSDIVFFSVKNSFKNAGNGKKRVNNKDYFILFVSPKSPIRQVGARRQVNAKLCKFQDKIRKV